MTDQEALNSTANEFQREIVNRNSKLRSISQQNENLLALKQQREKEISSIEVELEAKRKEIDSIDAIFYGKMADFQSHVDSVTKTLNEKEDSLTNQKSMQDSKEVEIKGKDIEISNRLKKIEYDKESIAKSLLDLLEDATKHVHEAIDSIKEI